VDLEAVAQAQGHQEVEEVREVETEDGVDFEAEKDLFSTVHELLSRRKSMQICSQIEF
jgi:hypothetical protein